jgi:hypothetical protein
VNGREKRSQLFVFFPSRQKQNKKAMGRGVAAFGKARVTDATLVERTTSGALSEFLWIDEAAAVFFLCVFFFLRPFNARAHSRLTSTPPHPTTISLSQSRSPPSSWACSSSVPSSTSTGTHPSNRR